jgi:exosortase/archaeosortase family protein
VNPRCIRPRGCVLTESLRGNDKRTLSMIHVPAFREGPFCFSLPGVTIEVAEECSGIRSTLSPLISTLLVGHLGLRSGCAKACFTLLALPVAILKNTSRIVLLACLGVYLDWGLLTGNVHHRSGLLFSLIGVGLLIPMFFLLRRNGRLASAGARRMTVGERRQIMKLHLETGGCRSLSRGCWRRGLRIQISKSSPISSSGSPSA